MGAGICLGEVEEERKGFAAAAHVRAAFAAVHIHAAASAPKQLCAASAALIFLLLSAVSCTKVGPDYVRPPAPVASAWHEADGQRVAPGPADYRAWWRVFNDPVLDRLIDTAYRQNLQLRIAGVRVLEARAQLGIAVGELYPQTQQVTGALQYNGVSGHSTVSAITSGGLVTYWQDQIGIGGNWEIDFWGKFRRNVESADASLLASVADYDNALVTLTADVAANYINIRTLEKRIEIAQKNVESQLENLKIVEARREFGAATDREVAQAGTLLNETKATVPALQIQLQQTKHALSILLGTPPSDLTEELSGPSAIPVPPMQVTVGIPADLIRRRPDVRGAEYRAMAQSAQIGVARAYLYPAFALSGNFGFLSTNIPGSSLGDISQWGSRNYAVGPGLIWNVLNYGQLTNNVRLQDARFQELLTTYQNTVLTAQQNVEDAIVAYLRSQERAELLAGSTAAAQRSLDLGGQQYRVGTTDFTTVIVSSQALLTEQDNFATTLGAVANNLVAIYRALGGGWEIREGKDLVPAEIRQAMAKRTNWGHLLDFAAYMPPETPEKERPLVRPPDW